MYEGSSWWMGLGASVQLTTAYSIGEALDDPTKMPLFRRQSEKARKKLQHQMYLVND